MESEYKPPKFMHAWHSPEQEKVVGVFLYPNGEGTILRCTEVSVDYMEHGWKDVTYLGLVLNQRQGSDESGMTAKRRTLMDLLTEMTNSGSLEFDRQDGNGGPDEWNR